MDVEITELEKIDAERVDGVAAPASGIPILLMKSIAAPEAAGADASKAAADGGKGEASADCPTCKGDGKIMGGKRDCPDCDAKGKVAPDKAKAIAAKSAVGIAVKAVTDGKIDQAPDISLGRQIMSLLAQAIQNEAQEIAAGSYGETYDVELLNCAAQFISRWIGHETAPGTDDDDSAGIEMLMQSAAKALGVANPLDKDNDASKSEIAKESTTVDTDDQGTGSVALAKAVEDAVTKAMGPLKERITALDAELAKVKAAPVPGGPVLSRNVQVKQPGGVANEDRAAKAAYFREQASLWDSQDRQTADGYRKLAREAEAEAVKQTS